MNSKSTLLLTLVVTFLLPTALVLAATPVKTLVGIPGITDTDLSFGNYINALYGLSISIAALLAVIKIIIAGMKYMLSDIVTSKADAIKDIRGALLGLLIVISAVLVLNIINPQLTQTNVFQDIKKINATPGSLVGSGTGSGGPLPTTQPGSPSSIKPSTEITCPERDCTSARQACLASGGKFGSFSGGASLTCEYSMEETYHCSSDDAGNTNCMEAAAKCSNKTGSIWTPHPNGQYGTCKYPR